MRFSLSILLVLFVGQLTAQTATEVTRGPIPVQTDSDEALGQTISYHAIMFAVEDYDDPNIRDLKHPVSDAKNLRDVLIEKYGFKSNNVKLLINPTESQIIQSLDSAVTTFSGTENLLVFFAGHGTENESLKESYWQPSDAAQDNPSSSIGHSSVLNYIKAIKSQHTLLISDACFSGGIVSDPGRSVSQIPPHLQQIHQDKSRKALTSGNKSRVPDESVFMKYLLKYLKQNTDEYLRTSTLHSLLSGPVSKNTRDRNGNGIMPIYAPMPMVGDENGEFIFKNNFPSNTEIIDEIRPLSAEILLERDTGIIEQSTVVVATALLASEYYHILKSEDFETLRNIYTDTLDRYHSLVSTTLSRAIQDHNYFASRWKIKSVQIVPETFKVYKNANGYTCQFERYWNLIRTSTGKEKNFKLHTVLEINNNNQIEGVYDYIIKR